MFDWFFAMPDWLYCLVFGLPAFAVFLYICRTEIKALWDSANNAHEPNHWTESRKASGLGWPESK